MKRVDPLRKKHPRFFYKGFGIKFVGKNLKITYDFFIEPNIVFHPEIVIKNVTATQIRRAVGENSLRNLAFHCGLAEILSYWKTTCSPEIVIDAGYLNAEQIRWWKDLFMKGMGQFFYENRINFRIRDFLTIKSYKKYSNILQNIRILSPNKNGGGLFSREISERHLVPMAGGRDSIVTVELLKQRRKDFEAFCVDPTKEAKAVMKVAGIKNPIIVERKMDPKLLELNKEGYLNGHTPFTSVLSFLSVFCAVLFDCRHVAFSNEKSANEGNVRYLGMTVNHQYSKSSEFEKKFSAYTKKYLAKNLHYFSLLRGYSDLEISQMFIKYPQYFPVFSSCNAFGKLSASRERKLNKRRIRQAHRRWCGECPKCLFVCMTLYPFLEKKQLLRIFGKDLFEDKKLLPIMKDLIDPKRIKPFECVGTKKESRKAFLLSKDKAEKEGQPPLSVKKKSHD